MLDQINQQTQALLVLLRDGQAIAAAPTAPSTIEITATDQSDERGLRRGGLALALVAVHSLLSYSVARRSREIGIRMAVGAKAWHVLVQFLSEAVVLASIGGLVGILLGLTAARLVGRFARWPILIQPESILLAFCFSAAIGIFFGYWPARKASMMDPIEALRYE